MTTIFLALALGAAAGALPVPVDLRSLGVGGVIAGITMYFYRTDRLSSEETHKEATANYAELTKLVIASLEKTSETNTRLATLIESDHRRGGAA
jgi:hypothetical protein